MWKDFFNSWHNYIGTFTLDVEDAVNKTIQDIEDDVANINKQDIKDDDLKREKSESLDNKEAGSQQSLMDAQLFLEDTAENMKTDFTFEDEVV